VIYARFDTEALTRVRFAVSPMLEMVRSVTALEDPAARALHLPWAEQTRPLTRELDLAPLRALQTSGNYNPDFVNPPPSGPLVEFEDELAVMVATPTAQIRAEVLTAYPDGPPAVLEPLLRNPRREIRKLADLMRAYWELALAEHWPRIRSLLEHDVLYRARQITDGGTQLLFADLDPAVGWEAGVLSMDCCGAEETALELDERGLLLLPSAFVWPKVTFVTAAPWQPTLIYPARGVGMLWTPDRPAPPQALARLLGRNRAAILSALDSPRSTTELARVLEISGGGVSQHLAVLHDAGLVSRRRLQRVVLYLRSEDGDALVQSAGAA
jgi:hypothetical protein